MVQATGHRFATLRSEWGGRVFKACPCDRYGHNLPPQVTVVGAGPAGIEIALHALHNLNVAQVVLLSRHAQSRLPQVEPTESYECHWFTRERMRLQPTAKNAKALLQQELKACYQVCNLPYPGWEALLQQIEDYPTFLENYLQTTNQSPNHPFSHLVRPVMSFYDQIKDLLSAVEQIGVLQLINRIKPLFATQSRPCAELMLTALQEKRLKLVAGEFLPTQATPTILQPDGTQAHPDCVILATGFVPSIPLFYPQASDACCYSVTGTSLSSVHRRAIRVASAITQAIKCRVSHSSFVVSPDLRL